MALSQHQLDKAKKAIKFLSSHPREGSGTSGASWPSPSIQSTSVRGSVNLSETVADLVHLVKLKPKRVSTGISVCFSCRN